MPPVDSLESWLDAQLGRSIAGMLASVSPRLSKTRAGFGHTIRALRGSIIASPVLADWDPEPDYFFHWFRDSAVVVDALRVLLRSGKLGSETVGHFADFVRFSLALRALDGRKLVADLTWRDNVTADFVRFLRTNTELAAVHGSAVVAETRVNPDGTLDISSWTRPQHDGAPLRALAVLRWMEEVPLDAELSRDAAELLRGDLEFTATNWREPSYDIWEEEKGLHYYTLHVSAAALEAGADWLEDPRRQAGAAEAQQRELARSYREHVLAIRSMLEGYWLEDAGHFSSRVLATGTRSTKELDIAVILAAIHAPGRGRAHTVRDPRMQATLARLEELFDKLYDINRNRPAHRGPALGRYAGDVYFSGGAYYFSTLGAAEFCFLAAAGAADAARWLARGDAYLATVREFVPASGEMSEQFDQHTGRQTSARHLAWSYAAFISCAAARCAVTHDTATRTSGGG